jgi:hypothetical protein
VDTRIQQQVQNWQQVWEADIIVFIVEIGMGSCQDCWCEVCIETLNLGHRKNAGRGPHLTNEAIWVLEMATFHQWSQG